MGHKSAIRITKSSFHNGEYYFVGMEGIGATITWQDGYKLVTETVDGDYNTVVLKVVKVEDEVSQLPLD